MSTQAEFVPTGTNVFVVPGAVIRHPANNPLNQSYAQANAAFGIDPNILARQRLSRSVGAPVQFTDPYADDSVAGSFYSGLAGFGSYAPPTSVGTRSAYGAAYDYTRGLMVSDRIAASRMGMTPPYGSYTGAMLPPSQLGHMNPAAARSFASGLGLLGRVRAIRHGMGGLGFNRGLGDDPSSFDTSITGSSPYEGKVVSSGGDSGIDAFAAKVKSDMSSGFDSGFGTDSGSSGFSSTDGSAGSSGGGVLSTISNIFGSVAKTTTAVLGQKPSTTQNVAGGVSPVAIAALAVGGLVLTIATVKILGKRRSLAPA